MKQPHESQAAAMARAGELSDDERRQVSAAQVVALCPICGEGRVTTHMEADDLIFKRCDTCFSEFAGATESRINKRLAVLTAALEMAVRQNSHDMLMTGDEIRLCEAAITATQEPQA